MYIFGNAIHWLWIWEICAQYFKMFMAKFHINFVFGKIASIWIFFSFWRIPVAKLINSCGTTPKDLKVKRTAKFFCPFLKMCRKSLYYVQWWWFREMIQNWSKIYWRFCQLVFCHFSAIIKIKYFLHFMHLSTMSFRIPRGRVRCAIATLPFWPTLGKNEYKNSDQVFLWKMTVLNLPIIKHNHPFWNFSSHNSSIFLQYGFHWSPLASTMPEITWKVIFFKNISF